MSILLLRVCHWHNLFYYTSFIIQDFFQRQLHLYVWLQGVLEMCVRVRKDESASPLTLFSFMFFRHLSCPFRELVVRHLRRLSVKMKIPSRSDFLSDTDNQRAEVGVMKNRAQMLKKCPHDNSLCEILFVSVKFCFFAKTIKSPNRSICANVAGRIFDVTLYTFC